ncbi:MAG TPA: calcium/proton exchanger [Blastocatellia bacterium]|nr:calcium/proton exchanger [Blastocatellia bacterium]
MRNFLRNPMNWLLVFIPGVILVENLGHPPAALVFLLAGLAIVPLAGVLVQATEQISHRTGPAIGGLLNATFGNAPELIIALVAMRAGQIDLVKASLVGAILGNLLFALGLSFLVGGIRHHTQEYNARGARVQSSMLMLAAISMILPSIFHNFITPETQQLEQQLNRNVALALLAAYALNLLFMLKTHPEYFAAEGHEEAEEGERWSVALASTVLVATSVALAFMSEILVGAVEETAKSLGLSKVFIGVIFLSLVGGAAETYAALAMARKNKLDLTVGIAVGSSQQIALFVAPLLVLMSYAVAPKPMNLVFGNAGLVIIFLAVLITAMLASDGKSNWFKGVQLLCVYALIALCCYFLPDNLEALRPGP